MLLAVDPGAGRTATIGVAIFELPSGQLKDLQMFTMEAFDTFLLNLEGITQVVYETYQIRRSKASAHVGSKVEVVESVGLTKAFARRNKIPFDEQPSSILPIAEKWFQIKMPGDHSKSHHISALLHGMYWLKQNGYIKTVLEKELNDG